MTENKPPEFCACTPIGMEMVYAYESQMFEQWLKDLKPEDLTKDALNKGFLLIREKYELKKKDVSYFVGENARLWNKISILEETIRKLRKRKKKK